MSKNDKSEGRNPDQDVKIISTVGGPSPVPGQPTLHAAFQELDYETGDPPEPDGVLGRTKDRRRLMTALALAQGEVLNAKKSSKNAHFKTTYADLAEIADACRAALSRHLIAWVQVPIISEADSWLETILTHGPSGQYITGRLPIPKNVINNSQDLVAAITYRRRVALASMVGVVSENDDDDGESEEGRTRTEPSGDQQPREQQKTANQRKAEEWADWFIRRLNRCATAQDLADLQEKHLGDLSSVEKLAPAFHAKVKDAMVAMDTKLAAAAEPGVG